MVRMKRWAVIFAVAFFVVFAVEDFVREFMASEPMTYFAVQPLRLFWGAAIAVGGGLTMDAYTRLAPRWQHKVRLLAIGLAASCVTIFTGYMVYVTAVLSSNLGVLPGLGFLKSVAWSAFGTAVLWFEFYQVFKRRVI